MKRYCKTARGHQEIAARSNGLGLRARRLLILVDGQRPLEDLARLAGDTDLAQTLQELVDGGFIDSSADEAPAPSVAAPGPARGAGAPGARQASLGLAQDFMMNTLRTFHGPYGKLDLVKRIHATTQADELRGLFDEWLSSISESRIGRKRADELSARLLEVIPA